MKRILFVLVVVAAMMVATAAPALAAPPAKSCGFTNPREAIADPTKPGASEITLLHPATPNKGGGGPPC